MHEALEWSSWNLSIDKFCDEFISPIIYKAEADKKDGSMINWLSTLCLHSFEFSSLEFTPKYENDYVSKEHSAE